MGSTARPRYIGLREISERDILELYCNKKSQKSLRHLSFFKILLVIVISGLYHMTILGFHTFGNEINKETVYSVVLF